MGLGVVCGETPRMTLGLWHEQLRRFSETEGMSFVENDQRITLG